MSKLQAAFQAATGGDTHDPAHWAWAGLWDDRTFSAFPCGAAPIPWRAAQGKWETAPSALFRVGAS